MVLSRDELLALAPPTETVEIEGHGKVIVRGLEAHERDTYEQSLIETNPDTGRSRVKRTNRNVRAALVIRCVVDEKGERLFTDRDLEVVGHMDAAVIDKLWDVARKLSGMDTGETEAIAEGFDGAQDDGSSSELP